MENELDTRKTVTVSSREKRRAARAIARADRSARVGGPEGVASPIHKAAVYRDLVNTLTAHKGAIARFSKATLPLTQLRDATVSLKRLREAIESHKQLPMATSALTDAIVYKVLKELLPRGAADSARVSTSSKAHDIWDFANQFDEILSGPELLKLRKPIDTDLSTDWISIGNDLRASMKTYADSLVMSDHHVEKREAVDDLER
tara:strand:- start:2037 stop:2648 length:612 start_codon:yes stop_codon:yes gene_type:complete